jgi:hypothetical protein
MARTPYFGAAVTQKQAERLVKEFRTYLDVIRDAAIRAKGKAEVTRQCDAETQAQCDALNTLYEKLALVITTIDQSLGSLPALEALLAEKKK